MSISNDVKQQLVNILKDSAIDILNNAEEYVGDVPYLCGITVTIDISYPLDKVPTILVNREFANGSYIKRMTGGK